MIMCMVSGISRRSPRTCRAPRRPAEASVRLHLHRSGRGRELDRVLDEEDRDVVADEVPVAFVGVELDREAAHVARRVHRAGAARDGGEADENRASLALLWNSGPVSSGSLSSLEERRARRAARVHDPLRNSLVIEVEDLLAQDEVFEQRRAAVAGAQGILVVSDGVTVVGRQLVEAAFDFRGRRLVSLAALAGAEPWLRLTGPGWIVRSVLSCAGDSGFSLLSARTSPFGQSAWAGFCVAISVNLLVSFGRFCRQSRERVGASVPCGHYR
jgi:hypothetical protein